MTADVAAEDAPTALLAEATDVLVLASVYSTMACAIDDDEGDDGADDDDDFTDSVSQQQIRPEQ